MSTIESLKLHPECHRVPMMRPAEYAEFLADIRERGVRVPVEVQPGTTVILDGRCRYTAAKEAGLTEIPSVEASLNGDDPVVYMLRAASKRRQLSDDQRAMLANEEREWLAKKGRERQREAGQSQGVRGKEGGRGRKKPLADASSARGLERDRSGESRQRAAKAHNVSERRVRQAQKVRGHDKALAEKVKAGQVSLAQAVRRVDREKKAQDLRERAAAAPTPVAQPWGVVQGDCLQELEKLKAGTARLVFADPPYNIGIDYGEGTKADRLADAEYLPWCKAWMYEARRVLSPDGSLWVLIGDEYAAEFGMMLKNLDFTIRAWVKWYETFGVNCSNNFNRCSRHLFYCVVNPKQFVFHAEAVNRLSDRQAKYHDSRADPAGKIWDDVWVIPRLVGTAMERIPEFPTQLPLALLRPVIGCATDSGDMVIDPFCGSGTTLVAATELGRASLGIEKSKRFADLAVIRLRGISNGIQLSEGA